MFKKLKIILLCLLVTTGISKAYAEDILPFGGQKPAFGVSDDANKTPGMLRLDPNLYLKVTLGTALVEGTDSISVYPPRSVYTNITTNTNTQIKSSAGFIFSISVNTAGTASTATLYDNTSCANPSMGIFTTTAQAILPIQGYYPAGLCITTAGAAAADITVRWK